MALNRGRNYNRIDLDVGRGHSMQSFLVHKDYRPPDGPTTERGIHPFFSVLAPWVIALSSVSIDSSFQIFR